MSDDLTQEQKFKFRMRMELEHEAEQAAAERPASLADKALGSFAGRVALGAASPLIGTAQLGAYVGDVANRAMGVEPVVSPWIDEKVQQLEASKQRGMKAVGNEGIDWAGLLGSVAPASLMAKGVTAAMPAASGLMGRAGVGAAQGALAAGTQPVAIGEEGFWRPKALQAGAGAVVGGLVSPVMEGAQKLGSLSNRLIEPFTAGGRTALLQRYQEHLLADDPAAKARIIALLQQAKPLVPGSTPTAGEALAFTPEATGLASHQRAVSKMEGISPLFTARSAEQEAARRAALGTIAQTPTALDAAILARKTAADPLYAAARAAGDVVDTAPIVTTIDDVLARNPGNRELTTELRNIKSGLLDEHGNLRTNSEHIASVLDGMKAAIADEKNKFIHGHLTSIKDALVKAIPGYEQAQQMFAGKSVLINQMQVGQELEKALTSSLGTSERGAMFANAIRNAPQTIKRATGAPRFDTLPEVLTPQQSARVQAVGEDLARKDALRQLAQKTNFSGAKAIHEGVQLPNLLSRPAMIANYVLKTFGQEPAHEQIARLAAQQYLNPAQLAAGLQRANVPSRYQPMIDAIMLQIPSQARVAIGRSQ